MGNKVQMKVHVPFKVRHEIKIAAALEGTTVSALVERLCIEYLRMNPEIEELIEKRG